MNKKDKHCKCNKNKLVNTKQNKKDHQNNLKNQNNQKQKEKGNDDMTNTMERPCTPSESLEQSLKEMKLIREGKLPKKNWKDFLKDLEDDDGEE